MSAPAKFLFDIDFDAPKVANTIPLADHQAKVEQAETSGYRKGFTAGQQEAQGETARRLAAAMEDIARSLDRLARGLSGVEQRVEAEAIEVAVTTGRKLASALIEREPFAEIQALAADCFRELVATPHVVVRVHDALYAEAQTRLAEIARHTGFDGRILVLAEPDIGIGDCRIEWADGGMTRDRAATDTQIEDTVRRFVQARRETSDIPLKGSKQ